MGSLHATDAVSAIAAAVAMFPRLQVVFTPHCQGRPYGVDLDNHIIYVVGDAARPELSAHAVHEALAALHAHHRPPRGRPHLTLVPAQRNSDRP